MRTITASLFAVFLVIAAGVGPVGVASGTTSDVSTQACSFPITETDASGTDVTVEEEPQRIVTLSPSAAQTMWEIGGKEKVVGVTQYASYLDGAESRENVSGSGDSFVNVEKVVALEPDLVLAPNVISPDTVQQFRDAGITVFRFEQAETIEDVYTKTERIGQLTGECEGAAETVSWMKDRIGAVEKAVEGEDRPRALYTFFGYTAGNNTFINKMIQTAGATNVAVTAGIDGFKPVSDEVVVNQNPEWLVLNSDSPAAPQTDAYNSTDAVKNNQTVVLNANNVSQPAPRIVYPIVKLAKAFHPEAAADITASQSAGMMLNQSENTAAQTETTAAGAETTATATETTDSPGLPGFGAVPAVVGIVLLGLFARRE